ncbi:hypothetical protein TNCV_5003741 [Trichonephila clavipes]|nr:hypothetical protein TNCV_5003741 [Trichonephila clavipes]
MDDNAPCHRTVAAEQLLERFGSSYLTTSNDSGASIGAARRMGSKCLNKLIPHSAWADAVETCLAVRDHIPY